MRPYRWDKYPRPRVVGCRLTEEDYGKLRFIVDTTEESISVVIERILVPQLDKKIKKLKEKMNGH